MNVLMISMDQTLAMGTENVIGDSPHRHILYGKYVSNLFIVAFAGKKKNLKVKKLSDNVIVYSIRYKNPFSYLWDAYTICSKICKKNRIDLIVTQDPLLTGLIGYLTKRKYGIPILMHLHGDYLDSEYWLKESFINPFLNILGKWLLKKADGIRVVGSGIKAWLIKVGIPGNKIYIISTPVNLSKFGEFSTIEVKNIRKKFSPDDGKIVLYVGRVSKEKNIANLLRAASIVLGKYPNTKFMICGEGEEKKKLKVISRNYGIENNVFFLGNVSHKDLPNYYHACDLFVLPSDYEGFGKVLLEAAMAEKPAVATNLSGPLDIIVNHKTGFLVPPRSPEQLAQKIIALIENPELGISLGTNAKKHVMKNFNPERNIQRIANLWKDVSLVGNKGSAR